MSGDNELNLAEFAGRLKSLDSDSMWDEILELIQEYWESPGEIKITRLENGTEIELITGGWHDNESLIDIIGNTFFWMFYWRESIRGGYYKFFVYRIGGRE